MKKRLLIFLMAMLCLSGCPGVQAQDSPSFGPVYQTLTTSNVYIDPALKGEVDSQALQQAAQQGVDRPHTIVKIAVMAQLPHGFQNRNQYASELHRALDLTKNGLIVVVANGYGAGVTVEADELDRPTRGRLAQLSAWQIQSNPTAGIAALAQSVAGAINSREYRSSVILWVIFFGIVGVITIFLILASRKKKQDLAAVRPSIEALRNNVLSGIEYLDGYIDVLPHNNPDSDQVCIFRQAASSKYEQAVKILDRATELSDLNRTQSLLDRAQADVQQARLSLDRATGGTSHIPGDEALRPEPLPAGQPEVERIPSNQRGVSFFSSRPAPLNSLTPVTIQVNGQSRQVLVTPEEADELRQGRMPRVRSFQVNGRPVPWYAYQGYDPYQDYWRYEDAGWGGFGSGLVAGWIGAEMLDTLFAPQYAPGFAPYAFATDSAYYQGYADAQYADPMSAGGDWSGGNADFADPNASANDWGGGGADFNDPNAGAGDWSGGNDWSGGSSDFGGSDSGDFGGGGADFGGGDS